MATTSPPRQTDYVPDEATCPLALHFRDKKKVVSMGSYLYREKWKKGNLNQQHLHRLHPLQDSSSLVQASEGALSPE